MLDLDRDERKLEAFLQLHKHDLLVADLRIFLPFTINLDPYLRKVLKEDQQTLEDEGIIMPMKPSIPLQNRAQILPPPQHMAGMSHHYSAPNTLVHVGNGQTMMSYAPNYFGNQSIAAPGFIANNIPATHMPPPVEPAGRRKSVIENINPFVGEKDAILSSDMLSAFPVRQTFLFRLRKIHFKIKFLGRAKIKFNFFFDLGGFVTCSINKIIS